jgi:hypothetical protein
MLLDAPVLSEVITIAPPTSVTVAPVTVIAAALFAAVSQFAVSVIFSDGPPSTVTIRSSGAAEKSKAVNDAPVYVPADAAATDVARPDNAVTAAAASAISELSVMVWSAPSTATMRSSGFALKSNAAKALPVYVPRVLIPSCPVCVLYRPAAQLLHWLNNVRAGDELKVPVGHARH